MGAGKNIYRASGTGSKLSIHSAMPVDVNTWGTYLKYRYFSPRVSDVTSPEWTKDKPGWIFHNSLPLEETLCFKKSPSSPRWLLLSNKLRNPLTNSYLPLLCPLLCHCYFVPSCHAAALLQCAAVMDSAYFLPPRKIPCIFYSTSLLPPSLHSQPTLCYLSSWKGVSGWIHVKALNWKWLT